MTTHSFPLDVANTAFLELLRTSPTVGRTYMCDDVYDSSLSYPYFQVDHMPAPLNQSPPLAGDGSLCRVVWQVTGVGKRWDQAQAAARWARARILTSDNAGGYVWPLVVAGWRCTLREAVTDGGTMGEGQPGHKIWNVPVRYALSFTPIE